MSSKRTDRHIATTKCPVDFPHEDRGVHKISQIPIPPPSNVSCLRFLVAVSRESERARRVATSTRLTGASPAKAALRRSGFQHQRCCFSCIGTFSMQSPTVSPIPSPPQTCQQDLQLLGSVQQSRYSGLAWASLNKSGGGGSLRLGLEGGPLSLSLERKRRVWEDLCRQTTRATRNNNMPTAEPAAAAAGQNSAAGAAK